MSKASKAAVAAKKKIKAAAASVAKAMKAANTSGSYGLAIANKSMVAQLGAMTRGMYSGAAEKQKSPKKKLSAAEKAARKRVKTARAAYAAKAARAARLSSKKGKKRSKVAPKKKTTSRAAAPAAKKPGKKRSKVPTVTADSVIKAAATGALKRWACEGPRRSGCGAGGTRVVNSRGANLVRIRPPRFMTAG